MSRSITGKLVIAVTLFCISMVSGCAIIAEFLGLYGTITGRAFSEYFAEDPSAIIEEYGIHALLSIDPPINGVSLIETDALGYFTIEEVSLGTYTIAPLHSPDRAVSVDVSAPRTYELELLTPEVGIYFMMIQTATSSPPLDVADVRVALSRSINRASQRQRGPRARRYSGCHLLRGARSYQCDDRFRSFLGGSSRGARRRYL